MANRGKRNRPLLGGKWKWWKIFLEKNGYGQTTSALPGDTPANWQNVF